MPEQRRAGQLVDYKSEQLLVFLSLFPTINKLVLQLVAEDGWHFHGFSHSGSNGTHDAGVGRSGSSCVAGLFSDTCGSPSKSLRFERARKRMHVRGREPRVFDGGCTVSIQEWLVEVEEACNVRNICLRERVEAPFTRRRCENETESLRIVSDTIVFGQSDRRVFTQRRCRDVQRRLRLVRRRSRASFVARRRLQNVNMRGLGHCVPQTHRDSTGVSKGIEERASACY